MGNARMLVPATTLDHESTIVVVVELSARGSVRSRATAPR
jgi:hypothetical protein